MSGPDPAVRVVVIPALVIAAPPGVPDHVVARSIHPVQSEPEETAMTNLATLLTGSASARGARIAVRHGTTALTYARLDDLSARTAALLQARGVRPGDRVA